MTEPSYTHHPVEDIEPEQERTCPEAEALAKILRLLSEPMTAPRRRRLAGQDLLRVVALRALVLAQTVRPDLVGSKTTIARRCRVDPDTVSRVVADIRRALRSSA